MALEPTEQSALEAFLSKDDRNKFIEDWLVEEYGIHRLTGKAMVNIILAPLFSLTGRVAGSSFEKIHNN